MKEYEQLGAPNLPLEGGANYGDALGIVTPAGYHRGQNPNTDDYQQESLINAPVVPSDIMELILSSDDPSQVVHDEIGLDGITLTSKDNKHDAACHLLADHGFIISPRDSGVKWYRQAVDIEGGGVVAWDYRGAGQSWMLELPGEQWMRDHERCRVATFTLSRATPMKCTRLDIRRDQYGQELQHVENVGHACKLGQLRRVKQFRPMDAHPSRSPLEHLARGWYLGSMKSDRFIRVYDKGLERGHKIPAQWERFEAEIRHALADASWQAMVMAEDEWVYTAFDHLVGVVDFRAETIRHATLAELDRPNWWTIYCNERVGVRPAMQREPTDAERFMRWVARCVLPTIESVRQRSELPTLADVWRALEREFRGVEAGGSELAVQGLVSAIPRDSLDLC